MKSKDVEGALRRGRAAAGHRHHLPHVTARLRARLAPRPAPAVPDLASGQAEIEVGDGTVARVGPGDVVLAEDLTGQGHVTRVVGDQPRLYAIVPLV
jgi:hypothetical protein